VPERSCVVVDPGMHGRSLFGNREISSLTICSQGVVRVERVYGFTKVRYRGLKKNHEWMCAAFALVNLYQHRNRLAPQGA
jgi:IS5 family transposase